MTYTKLVLTAAAHDLSAYDGLLLADMEDWRSHIMIEHPWAV